MSILDITHERFVKAINVANNSTLTLADVVFSRARENGSAIHPGDTLIRVKSRDDRKLIGSTICGYTRIRLSVLGSALGGQIRVPDSAQNVNDIVPYLYLNYGVRVDKDEFEPATVQSSGGMRTITLTAKPDSVFFTGNVMFELLDCPVVETKDYYVGLGHVEDNGTQFAETYKWILNATAEKAIMATITTGTVDFKELSEALARVTGHPWTWEGVGPYSLQGAVVRRAGLTDTLWGTNKSYAYAIVIELSSACTNMQGNLYIHFN